MRPEPSRFPILRPPPARLVLVVLLALVVGSVVHRTTAGAEEVRTRLGTTMTVAVANRPLDAGEDVGARDITLVERPVAHVPRGATTDDPTGRTVRAPIGAGEIVVDSRLADDGRHGPAALVPQGWRAIAVAVVDVPLPASPGDVVDVVASFDPTVVSRDPSLVVAADAVVVDVSDAAVTVAVPRSRLTQVAFALANGIVTLALVG